MNQIQLDCFMSAALNGSLSTAAKSLFLSTQVVSQHIQKLETELGTPLFTRTKTAPHRSGLYFSMAAATASAFSMGVPGYRP